MAASLDRSARAGRARHLPDRRTNPIRALTGVRMDVCAFVGVAPRGPARAAVFRRRRGRRSPCTEGETVQLGSPGRGGKLERLHADLRRVRGAGAASLCGRVVLRQRRPTRLHRSHRPSILPSRTERRMTRRTARVSRGRVSPTLTAEGGREVWIAARNEGAGAILSARSCPSRPARWRSAPTDFFSNRLRLPMRPRTSIPAPRCRLLARRRSAERFAGSRRSSKTGIRPTARGRRWAWFDLAIGDAGGVRGAGRGPARYRRRRKSDRDA